MKPENERGSPQVSVGGNFIRDSIKPVKVRWDGGFQLDFSDYQRHPNSFQQDECKFHLIRGARCRMLAVTAERA